MVVLKMEVIAKVVIPDSASLNSEVEICVNKAITEIISKLSSTGSAVDLYHSMDLVNIHLILKFIKPRSPDHFERCRASLEYMLPAPADLKVSELLSLAEPAFEKWVYQTYGPLTVKKFYEFKDLPDPSLFDILKYQFSDSPEHQLSKFIHKLTATERIVLSVWLDRIADPECAMLKAGIYNKFRY